MSLDWLMDSSVVIGWWPYGRGLETFAVSGFVWAETDGADISCHHQHIWEQFAEKHFCVSILRDIVAIVTTAGI